MPVSQHPRPYRKGSIFGDGRRSCLDGNQRARFRFKLRSYARSGYLAAKHQWVGEALLKRLGEDGRCDPSHDTLAADAGCSARTVRRATATMRDLGMLRWETRIVRNGWQAHQTSNAYELCPDTPAPAICHGGQGGRQTRRLESIPVAGPSEGSDDWGRWNRDRQLALLLAG